MLLVCRVQYIPRNMHTVFALLCFVVFIHWLIFPYPSGLLHWHCGNLTIAPVPAKQPWWIWINTSCEFIMNDCITTTKQSTTKPCAYFLGYTVCIVLDKIDLLLYLVLSLIVSCFICLQGIGTKESVLVEIMCSRNNAQIKTINDTYKRCESSDDEWRSDLTHWSLGNLNEIIDM